MLHACNGCPGKESLRQFLTETFVDYEKEDVNFNQWKKDDKNPALVPLQMCAEDFIEEVCSHFDMLREHHFISKAIHCVNNSI